MIRLLITLLLIVFGCACEVDYDFRGKNQEPQVVVNALISPQEPFALRLSWSRGYTPGNKFEPVANARFSLYENGVQVAQGTTDKLGIDSTDFRATAGRGYRLEISVEGYGELKAETEIPQLPSVDFQFVFNRGSYHHFKLNNLAIGSDVHAIWIDGWSLKRRFVEGEGYEGGLFDQEELYGFYTPSLFIDQINAANDAYESEDKGSTVEFDNFMRIASENRKLALPLQFSIYGHEHTKCQFRIIVASQSYDRYRRSRYKHMINSDWGAEGNPFAEQITVYSNVENGIGIFAGLNVHTTPKL